MSLATNCPISGSTDLKPVFKLGNVPVICNQLWPDADAARAAPAGDVDLVICPETAMIWNAAFEPERMVYAPGYENALHFSPKFQAFAEELAKGLVDRFDLKGKHVFEIGCGDGRLFDVAIVIAEKGNEPAKIVPGGEGALVFAEGAAFAKRGFEEAAVLARQRRECMLAKIAARHDGGGDARNGEDLADGERADGGRRAAG